MHRIAAIALAALVVGTTAQASEVFVTKDAQGRPVYTDRPDSLPAEKVDIATQKTDTVEAQQRYENEMKNYAAVDKAQAEAAKKAAETRQAKELTAADKAKRCQDARTQYQNVMNARRLYEDDGKGGRRYLDSAEIDATRADAKKMMDEFCSGK
ncbi:MAG TPA: DUF4124 domain-containing protein [Steroidobacteraceae bacterium]